MNNEQQAEIKSINRNAPVVASGEILIAATPEKIWNIMTSIEQWPLWNPDVQWAELRGQIMPGTRFIWKAGPGTITSTIQKVEYERYIVWCGSSLGIKAIHTWQLEPVTGGTRVRTEESWEGLLPRLLKGSSQKQLERAIQTGLQHLKTAAERA
jgi:hypothetical protein